MSIAVLQAWHSNPAFPLIELLVVTAIIALLAGLRPGFGCKAKGLRRTVPFSDSAFGR